MSATRWAVVAALALCLSPLAALVWILDPADLRKILSVLACVKIFFAAGGILSAVELLITGPAFAGANPDWAEEWREARRAEGRSTSVWRLGLAMTFRWNKYAAIRFVRRREYHRRWWRELARSLPLLPVIIYLFYLQLVNTLLLMGIVLTWGGF